MTDAERRIQNSITKLNDFYVKPEPAPEIVEFLLYEAMEYAADGNGQYFIIVPGAILPVSS